MAALDAALLDCRGALDNRRHMLQGAKGTLTIICCLLCRASVLGQLLSGRISFAFGQHLRQSDESHAPVVSAVEVREQLSQFQESTRSKVRDVRHEISSLERKVQLEVISQRLNSMVGDSVSTLSDRLTDLEQTVQSRRTTPVTDVSASQVPVEALASVEQAFTHEVERLKDECDRSISRQHDLLERFDQKQRSLERQLTGLTSFGFLEQSTSGGATAPEREKPTATLGQTPGQLEIPLSCEIKKQSELEILGA